MNPSLEIPPVLNEIEEDLKEYLLCPEKLPIHQYERNQEFWPREPNLKELIYFEGAPICSTLTVQRDLDSGEIIEFKEVLLKEAHANAKNSMSLNRAPAPPSESTRGNASYVPFWPASFPRPVQNNFKVNPSDEELLSIPPRFTRGLVFADDGKTLLNSDGLIEEKRLIKKEKKVINLLDIVQQEQDLFSDFDNPIQTKNQVNESTIKSGTNLPEEDEILPKEAPVLEISKSTIVPHLKSTEWAIMLDASKPVTNFRERIPEMAREYDFELDTFQKLAILELEKRNHVFVAAHTSAGKTVVAEYAIALSQKHMTRTIYTSPIKALSNQKYRDFKKIFKDVGLITGDFQINQTASCLIMTTEILRSMLYCGSDITRDLEFVIFDEVHYVNDKERGHVWEQVLILLPSHVCVVLLSATVSNTRQFADWLGRTHLKKVYVVTTDKRPVPLQHFLYTGKGGATRDNRYLILDAEKWQYPGYHQAKESLKKSEQQKFVNDRGPLHPKQEQQIWIGLIDHLKRHDLLPVVAFTFSRQKCDNNAANLASLDLTTQKEKALIRMFFDKCVRCLKKEDRSIPQIVHMKEILVRGVGVHHSGILPIIKEIVEMLFQNGHIKLLFATETFAMGVNMPARTVVFDSVRKHDGKELRDLEPAEYIQMAGRAGRRGLDKQGTVIILCKRDVPPEDNLKKMMLGKSSPLESQFRLTYGMVLSLLRVESLTVEGMMSRSFKEADHQKNLVAVQKELEDVEKEINELNQEQLSNYLQPLADYFKRACAFLDKRKEIIPLAFTKLAKVMQPGRILLVTKDHHINKLALLLSVNKSKDLSYKVLVLKECDDIKVNYIAEPLWHQMIALCQDKLFQPHRKPGHEVITIQPLDIFEISDKTLKINTDVIIQDWEKRQIERFRNDPPGQTCQQAIHELLKLTTSANDDSNLNKLEFLHFINDLKLNDQELYYNLLDMYDLKDKVIDHLPSTQIPNFTTHFSSVFKRKFLEEKAKDLKHKLSNYSLTLYPDYEKRIELLQKLKYVDNQNRVQLKGKFACEMGMNELLITEMVLRNILTKLTPAEVAALLSCLVFKVKLRDEPLVEEELTPDLKLAIEETKMIHQEIGNLEISLGIHTQEFQEDLNFGLVHVVYDWASAKPFAEIMRLTTVQEGIIVRCMQQLNETICDIKNAAGRIIGERELQTKMEEASTVVMEKMIIIIDQ